MEAATAIGPKVSNPFALGQLACDSRHGLIHNALAKGKMLVGNLYIKLHNDTQLTW